MPYSSGEADRAASRKRRPKPATSYTVVGTSPARKDALEKVTGRARYAADMGLPGTLHARIVRPPAHGASLEEIDTSAAAKIPGVRVVRDGDLVAVLHERPDVADRALTAVTANWKASPQTLDHQTIFDHLAKAAPEGRIVTERGSLAEGETLAATVFEETYRNAYVAHAAMETHAAVARIENGKATVWASTQAPFSVRTQVSEALGLPPQMVHVVTPYVGGASAEERRPAGRRSRPPGEADGDSGPGRLGPRRGVLPRHVPPAAVVTIRSGLDGSRKICLWTTKSSARGPRGAVVLRRAPPAHVSSGGWQGRQPPGLHPFGVGRGERRRSTRTPSRASRRSTSWPPRPASTRWRSAGATSAIRGC